MTLARELAPLEIIGEGGATRRLECQMRTQQVLLVLLLAIYTE